jgi:hypothetical protein
VKPVLQALVLAEKVYEEKTGKKIICGTFTQIWFTKDKNALEREVTLDDGSKQRHVAGGMHGGPPYVYLSLTDVCQGTELTLQFVSITKNTALFGTKAILACDDRLKTIEMVLALPMLPINEPGTYAFEVLCDGEILGSYRIVAKEIPLRE